MIYLINRGSWLINMKQVFLTLPTDQIVWKLISPQCPPLAVTWIYVIVQLDLGPSVASLAIVGAWVWWKQMKLVF
jgi:hypothetical protein